MRVLLVYPELPKSFFTLNKPLKMLGKKGLQPPLGLLTLAAILPSDWDLRLLDLSCGPISPEDWEEADMVFLSGMLIQLKRLFELVREARSKGKIVAVGGPGVFHMPEDALRAGADLVVKGEGEVTVRSLLHCLNAREFGRIIAADEKADLRKTPLPRYDLIRMDDYADMAIQFSRGCPFECEFCLITCMLGRKVRVKEPHQILSELDYLYRLGWRRNVFFVDDNLIGNPGKAKAMLRELIPWMERKQYPFTFNCQASINLAEDPELLDLMERAGFCKAFLGIESLEEKSLRLSGKHQNLGVDVGRACRTINRAGLLVQAGCIIGFDTESPGSDRRFIDFARENHIPEVFLSMLQTAPGTALWSRLEKENRLLPVENFEQLSNNAGIMNFIPKRPIGEISNELAHAYDALYDPGAYLERVYRHIEHLGSSKKKPFRFPYLFELRAVLMTIVNYGLLYRSRWKFWKYFFGVLRKCSWNLDHFFTYCIVGEHFLDYRKDIERALNLQIRTLQLSDRSGGGNIPRSE